ncbi:glutamine synthetase III [Oribacterium sp. P9]|uniref:glutamine synthetase III family protein n=1 Tax=unclassified Oribacterium TaxID=2629782 RepID=UPI002A79160F|nr:glutamine synthetase III [Oribacterium sp.]MDD6519142.1 glutamine synthetase III [Oribacterium sp.]MDY2854170.1 glutamine synthetase III [Oliverpabstia sp.]
MSTTSVPELYGSLVFNDKVMRERLPKDIYKAVHKTIQNGSHLELDVANTVAATMKEWALELGATHFTHWFQPMTGLTAEKHDSFISPTENGGVIMEFSGKELVKGEPDASSFPSGGLRATFEARGYTAWDPSSPAFIKDGTLYIPTAFCSYSGESLDKKTPLLRSMETLSDSATKLLHILGKEKVTRVDTTVGSEQEYFLIDKDLYNEREDLMLTGRTLIGAPAPKGQEMEDHYFGVLKPKVSEFMHDLDQELWKLGVPAKTKHNEVAPSQHELAPVFETANIAVDHNQLTMEMMKKVADKHNYACLLHEKPFEGINGSGKHNNWSMITSEGENLLDPGKTPGKNVQFLLFLMGIVSAVDEYADLMRVSVATAGNDHRLGANEAPPAIVSIYVGDELEKVLESIENGEDFTASDSKQLETGAHVLPHFVQDNTDRNRTSPFAFTGNKFEFRMPGSSLSVADPNIVLNTAVAEALDQICAKLEHVDPKDLETEAMKLVKELLKKHRRIIFNGNGYTDEWVAEAEKRGLYNLKSLPEAMPQIKAKKNKELFEKHHVFTEIEIDSRYEIYLENYSKTIRIEALTMLEMVKKDFTDGLMAYETALTDTAIQKKQVLAGAKCTLETSILTKLDAASEAIGLAVEKLEKDLAETQKITDSLALATAYHDTILADMDALRAPVDAAEEMIPETYLPYPTYSKLLFSLR